MFLEVYGLAIIVVGSWYLANSFIPNKILPQDNNLNPLLCVFPSSVLCHLVGSSDIPDVLSRTELVMLVIPRPEVHLVLTHSHCEQLVTSAKLVSLSSFAIHWVKKE